MSFSSATVVDPAGAKGLFTGGGFHLLGLEVLAAVVTAAYAFGASWLFAQVTQRLIGLRVEPEHEEQGLDLSQHAERAYSGPYMPEAERSGGNDLSVVDRVTRDLVIGLEERLGEQPSNVPAPKPIHHPPPLPGRLDQSGEAELREMLAGHGGPATSDSRK